MGTTTEHPPWHISIPSSWTRLHSHNVVGAKLGWEPNHEIYRDDETGIKMKWDSRSHRKGIPALPASVAEGGEKDWSVRRRKMRFVGFDYWDISWWVAIIFTVGSVFWCINAILFFCYFDNTTLAFTNTESATAFIGGTLFLFGAYLGWVESMNPARDADFGWEIDHATRTLIEPRKSTNALGRRRRHFGSHLPLNPTNAPVPPTSTSSISSSSNRSTAPAPKWKWYGTYPSLAYWANTIQLFGATSFFISVLCGLPGVLPLSGAEGGPEQAGTSEGLWVGLYWATQVIGSPCFVIAGAMFSLEVQKTWWKPAVTKLGWQIGFWNFIGGWGFFFCGVFGIWRQTSLADPSVYQRYGTALSTFWGSWAFLIGSYLQLWEGINKRT